MNNQNLFFEEKLSERIISNVNAINPKRSYFVQNVAKRIRNADRQNPEVLSSLNVLPAVLFVISIISLALSGIVMIAQIVADDFSTMVPAASTAVSLFASFFIITVLADAEPGDALRRVIRRLSNPDVFTKDDIALLNRFAYDMRDGGRSAKRLFEMVDVTANGDVFIPNHIAEIPENEQAFVNITQSALDDNRSIYDFTLNMKDEQIDRKAYVLSIKAEQDKAQILEREQSKVIPLHPRTGEAMIRSKS